jgi:hypothetical protein
MFGLWSGFEGFTHSSSMRGLSGIGEPVEPLAVGRDEREPPCSRAVVGVVQARDWSQAHRAPVGSAATRLRIRVVR